VAAEPGRPIGLARLGGAVLVVATALFVVGAFAERSQHHESGEAIAMEGVTTTRASATTVRAQAVTTAKAGAGEAAEGGTEAPVTGEAAEGGTEAPHASAAPASSSATNSESTEGAAAEYRPLGVDLERTGLIITAAAVSILVAVLVVRWPRRTTLLVATALAVAFTIIEVVEVGHQADVSRWGLLTLAALALLAHAAAAVVMALGARGVARA
jgi:hypothetical protein